MEKIKRYLFKSSAFMNVQRANCLAVYGNSDSESHRARIELSCAFSSNYLYSAGAKLDSLLKYSQNKRSVAVQTAVFLESAHDYVASCHSLISKLLML